VSIRMVVHDRVRSIADQQRKLLPPLTDDLRMLESGLDSLCIAILIANLDDELNLNPFDADDAEIPVTLGDLVRVYENAAENAAV
jgi:acyl carrier protein